jgi:hypothetical protein
MPNPTATPFPFGIQRSRATWDGIIRRYGDIAILRRQGLSDRWCSIMQATISLAERLGKPANPMDRRMLISALAPDTGLLLDPEPSEKDVLITLVTDDDGGPISDQNGNPQEDERLRLFSPPGHAGPSRNELFWRFDVRA